MSDPLPLGKKVWILSQKIAKKAINSVKNNSLMFAALMLLIFGLMLRLLGSQSLISVKAEEIQQPESISSPIFEQKSQLFEVKNSEREPEMAKSKQQTKKHLDDQIGESNDRLAQQIYSVVGETPIRQMVPYIAERDAKVAAFLVAIAKKESSFGLASPSKDGKDCYNYWGFKGQGGQGESMGYACFASSQEAIQKVGDRIQVLVEKNVVTPQRMVDIWKCGSSCANDPGASGWVSTVSLYYNKITS